ncbi:helix-turn-helix domain-containing protein [Actinacidiphila sp. DG2A-62]|uniref:helix-turn-helix domain-containing protein n=1 Tax=Actinacidiphila sp. DG2A-62 TaxID=3108821 RepID=UPI002DB95E55|nr:helix-turn-helix domain-containing protein [Actinacidiphila sp. DG2A-62]MEC3993954.1 helix-turn-helix domain-containing protein [Actinacidiphila sp. DG2A-62]
MTNERDETFVQLMAALMKEYGVNESEISRAIGVHTSTVYKWTSGERGGQRGPRADALRKLAAAYPKFTEARIFAAVGRQAPGSLDEDAEARLLTYFRELTAEQQQMLEVQARAVAERNRTGQ